MTKRKQAWIALLSAAVLLMTCLFGAVGTAADGEDETPRWHETEDGQFLYRTGTFRHQDGVQVAVVYIGDGDDVTVPAAFGGKAADLVWFTDLALDLEFDESEQAQTWRAKARAAEQRYLNLTFEEGPTGVEVTSGMWPGYIRATSVTLPKSATDARLYVEGLAAVSVPEGSALTGFSLYNVLYGVEDPQPTTIDLTGATGLVRVIIGRDEYSEDCFTDGSVLKLPAEFKDVPILRENPSSRYENPYLFIDYDPMPLTVEYADDSEGTVPSQEYDESGWHVTDDGQFLYRFMKHDQVDCVMVVYAGDDTDVTVPAAYDGKFPYMVWLANDVVNPDDVSNAYLDKIQAAAERYLNFTFEDGPIKVWVKPNLTNLTLNYVRARSVKLPTSVVSTSLYVKGAASLSVPQVSFLHDFWILNVLEGVEDPQPTTIDLTGTAYLERVWISRGGYRGDCFAPGSVIKLPTDYKRIPLQREAPVSWSDPPFFYIDYDPMPLTVQYADGTEIVVPPIEPDEYIPGDANFDDEVNMKDVLALRFNIAALAGVRIPLINRSAADVDGDGELSMKDVLLLRKFIAGLVDRLGAPA